MIIRSNVSSIFSEIKWRQKLSKNIYASKQCTTCKNALKLTICIFSNKQFIKSNLHCGCYIKAGIVASAVIPCDGTVEIVSTRTTISHLVGDNSTVIIQPISNYSGRSGSLHFNSRLRQEVLSSSPRKG